MSQVAYAALDGVLNDSPGPTEIFALRPEATGQRVSLIGFEISCNIKVPYTQKIGGSADATNVLLRYREGFGDNGPGLTEVKRDPGASAIRARANSMDSEKHTLGSTLAAWHWKMVGPLRVIFPKEIRPTIWYRPAGVAPSVIHLTFDERFGEPGRSDALEYSGWFSWEEET